jgi:hypothetical protein
MSLPYSKKKDESPEAFEAFAHYRDQGVGRSLRLVAEALGKSEALMGRWSSRHTWIRRAHAYDAELDRRKRLADLGEVEKMRRRQTKLALQMQHLGALELSKMVAEAERRKKKRGSLDDALILKLIDAGSKLERLNRGEPGEIVQSNAAEGVDLAGLSLPELKQLRALRAKVKRRQLEAQERAATEDDD